MVVEAQPALVLEKLTVDVPRSSIASKVTQLTQQYNLADPSFHIQSRIDLIIGNAIFPQLLTQNQFSLGPNLPTALGTRFGFVLMGTAPCSLTNPVITNNTPATSLNVCLLSKSDVDLHASLQRFWVQEEPPTSPSLTHEEALCDQHFRKTVTRDENGRYIVRLPFKDSSDHFLGDSKPAAETRLYAMDRKFRSNDQFSQLYHDSINVT
ncbi:uncharacterized protein LOC128998831 [Macrosteles quadrilineatus]|uniref:uncharacterized protein LOC128998831 n=1 Tax=Macrosteles quadrilineatus TaxID=74068 RepID=UPI0023E3088E|nr:uncharacterized protein LOC128998831 [Macrosteles quadrilineatus]